MPDGTVTRTGAAGIEAAFAAARGEGRAALMPYLMGGFPDQEIALAVAAAYADAGADLIELGVPFSDPLADGPTIQAADTAALAAGATLGSVLETCAAVGERLPVALMVYSNMVLATGAAEFADRAGQAKASGVIVPDLPVEEQGPIREALARAGPRSHPAGRADDSAGEARPDLRRGGGGVRVSSSPPWGVTGEREQLPPELTGLIAAAKQEASVPVAVGFGISTTPEQAADVGEVADGVIIGTRLVRAVADAPDRDAAVAAVTGFLRDTPRRAGWIGSPPCR